MSCEQLTIEQTLFLGCSVQGFSCNLGWNEDVTTVTVDLVRDTCQGDRVWYDLTQSNPANIRRTESNFADPGLMIYGSDGLSPPEIGAPCYFRFGDFEFTGLLQNWKKTAVGSDVDTYQVLLSSPTELLSGVQLILDDYSGPVKGFNLFNVYGLMEYLEGTSLDGISNFTQFAADGVLFGTLAGGYGGADTTEAGMPWTKVREGIQILTSSLPNYSLGATRLGPDWFTEYGRIAYVGAARSDYGLLPADYTNIDGTGLGFAYADDIAFYAIDISDIPVANIDYRISGPTADLLTVISQVCQDLRHDYFIELVPIRINGTLVKVIKFRTVSRLNVPDNLGIVQSFVDELATGANNKVLVDAEYGRELRNEGTTRFLIGGQKRSMYQVYNGIPFTDPDDAFFTANYPGNAYVRDIITPYYGKDPLGNVIVENADQTITVSLAGVKPSLNNIGALLPNSVSITKNQLQASETFDQWLSVISWDTGSALYQGLLQAAPSLVGGYDSYLMPQLPTNTKDGLPAESGSLSRDVINISLLDFASEAAHDLQKLYSVFDELRVNSRTKMMVRLPFVSAKRTNFYEVGSSDPSAARVVTSDIPVEGGWTEHNNVLGLPNPGGVIDFFKNLDGTIPAIARYDYSGNLDLSALGDRKYYYAETVDKVTNSGTLDISTNNVLFTTMDVSPEIVFLDQDTATSPRVIISPPDVSNVFLSSRQNSINDQLALQEIDFFMGNVESDIEGAALDLAFAPDIIEPSGVCIPFESQENTYGPWKPNNIIEAGPPGRIEVEKDDTLVPWTYGSYANMNTIAQQKASDSVGGYIAGENGSITIAGYPNAPLGSELASVTGLVGKFYTDDTHLFENRSTSTNIKIYSAESGHRKSTDAPLSELQSVSSGDNLYYMPYINYGAFDGSYGPNVNSISVDYGIQGITTTYTFRTYSPKFGSLSKYRAEKLGKQLRFANELASRQRYLQTSTRLQNENSQQFLKELKRNRRPGAN